MQIQAEKPKDSAYPAEIRTLGDQLRAKRLDLGLYQSDVARLLDVTECSIWNWENNRTEPNPTLVPQLTKFLRE